MGSRRRAYDRQLIARGARLAYRVAEEVPFCWLCPAESGRRAKEHIFALSLQRALKAEEEQFTPTHVDSLGRVVSARQTIPAKALLAGEVCEGCNSGWMSRLEAEAAPLLLTRVRGEARRSLGEQEQLTLARWFFKTAIVLNSSQNYRLLLPKDVRHSARIGLHPDVRVFVARRPLNPQDRLSFRQGYSGMFSVTPKEYAEAFARLSERVYAGWVGVEDWWGVVIYAPPGGWARSVMELRQLWPYTGSLDWAQLPLVSDLNEAFMLTTDPPDLLVRVDHT